MVCQCNYSSLNGSCVSCNNIANPNASADITQKRIWKQVRVPSSMYAMNLASLTSASNRLAKGINWNQMSDRFLAAKQIVIVPTRGNSVTSSITSNRPGGASPGGVGVDVKHDSYARFLNRKKAANIKTQTQQTTPPLNGNKTNSTGLIASSIECCN